MITEIQCCPYNLEISNHNHNNILSFKFTITMRGGLNFLNRAKIIEEQAATCFIQFFLLKHHKQEHQMHIRIYIFLVRKIQKIAEKYASCRKEQIPVDSKSLS